MFLTRLFVLVKCLPLLFVFCFAACGTVGGRVAGIDNFDRVSPELLRGAQPSAEGFQTLAAMNVKTIINLRDGDDTQEVQWAHEAGMTYVRIPLDAEKVTAADADRVLQAITDAQGPVFVHCLVGRDRTGMAVAAYRMNVQGWTRDAAVKDMNAHGHFWAFYPKVRQALTQLAEMPKGNPLVASARIPAVARN